MNYNSYIYGRWVKLGIAALIIIILAVSSISTYNGLVTADQQVQMKWSTVESMMQRRADVINNQVEAVKGYMQHEEKVFSDIAAARAVLYDNYSDVESKIAADEQLSAAGNKLLALVENYPELKAGTLFENLQIEIEGSENRVSVARKDFIEAIQLYNTKVSRFPGNIFAKLMGFEKKEYFKASPGAQEAPKVDFSR
ncbi:MAG TPA: LemA family protein [Clostridiales bacterium]|nr:LemA family protein [Clostridiales bacterium]HPZ05432.1 LemA family protein [Clostridiales bacterium]HQD31351.1 LemA family protein [Clostridiales bacterium]